MARRPTYALPSPTQAVRGTQQHGLSACWDWYATLGTLAGAAGGGRHDARAEASGLPPVDSLDLWPLISGRIRRSPRVEVPLGSNFEDSSGKEQHSVKRQRHGNSSSRSKAPCSVQAKKGGVRVGGLISPPWKLLLGNGNEFIRSTTAEIACSSSHKNDASIRKCEPWCDSEQSGRHCSWCKCKGCGICRRSQPSPLVLASAAHDRTNRSSSNSIGQIRTKCQPNVSKCSVQACEPSPERGCLYNVWRDPSETDKSPDVGGLNNGTRADHLLLQYPRLRAPCRDSRAAAEPEVFRRLLARVEQLQAGVYDPHRGHSWADAACRAALTEHHGHWGPFVA